MRLTEFVRDTDYLSCTYCVKSGTRIFSPSSFSMLSISYYLNSSSAMEIPKDLHRQRTPLHVAAGRKGNLKIVELIVNKLRGEDKNPKGIYMIGYL